MKRLEVLRDGVMVHDYGNHATAEPGSDDIPNFCRVQGGLVKMQAG